MKVVDLKALAKERGLRGYSRLKKAELITFLQNNLGPTPAPRTRPTSAPRTKPPKPTRLPPSPPQMSTWEPIDDRLKPTPNSVRFKPDTPRQPPNSQNSRPYQLKPKEVRKLL